MASKAHFMEIDMSYYTTNDQLCGSCDFEIDDLDLTSVGFPGLSFTGSVSIEPDESVGGTEWYIDRIYALNADGCSHTRYSVNSPISFHRGLAEAIEKAVVKDKDYFDLITEKSHRSA